MSAKAAPAAGTASQLVSGVRRLRAPRGGGRRGDDRRPEGARRLRRPCRRVRSRRFDGRPSIRKSCQRWPRSVETGRLRRRMASGDAAVCSVGPSPGPCRSVGSPLHVAGAATAAAAARIRADGSTRADGLARVVRKCPLLRVRNRLDMCHPSRQPGPGRDPVVPSHFTRPGLRRHGMVLHRGASSVVSPSTSASRGRIESNRRRYVRCARDHGDRGLATRGAATRVDAVAGEARQGPVHGRPVTLMTRLVSGPMVTKEATFTADGDRPPQEALCRRAADGERGSIKDNAPLARRADSPTRMRHMWGAAR